MTRDKIYSKYAVMLDKVDLFKLGARSIEEAKIVLIMIQNYFNNKLQLYKKVYLHEVYEALGVTWSDKLNIKSVGWRYDPNDTNIDNYIDFSIFELANLDFINGCEDRVILDFNVDGIID